MDHLKQIWHNSQLVFWRSIRNLIRAGIQEFRITGSNCSFYQHNGQLNPQALRSITPSSSEVPRSNPHLIATSKNFWDGSNLEETPHFVHLFARNVSVNFLLKLQDNPSSLASSRHQPLQTLQRTPWITVFWEFTGGYWRIMLIWYRKHTIPIELEITNLVSSSQAEYNDFNPLSISNFSSLGLRGTPKMPDDLLQLEQFFEEKLKEIEVCCFAIESQVIGNCIASSQHHQGNPKTQTRN